MTLGFSGQKIESKRHIMPEMQRINRRPLDNLTTKIVVCLNFKRRWLFRCLKPVRLMATVLSTAHDRSLLHMNFARPPRGD